MTDTSGPGPSEPTDDVLRQVLLGVRLVGFGPPEEVARRAGLEVDVVVETLVWSERAEFVAGRHGTFPGWSLTTDGRVRGETLLGLEVGARDAAAEIRGAYADFLELNQAFLNLCTSWQLKTVEVGRFVPNHHDDPEYDAAVIIRLGETHERILPVTRRLAAALDRFGEYGPRLDRALRLVETGDLDWFTRPVIDSYHTVWFELHEDLLATLGLERGQEQ